MLLVSSSQLWAGDCIHSFSIMNLSIYLLNSFVLFLLYHWLLQVCMVMWFYSSTACWMKMTFFNGFFFKLLPDNSQIFFSTCIVRRWKVAIPLVCHSWFYNNLSYLPPGICHSTEENYQFSSCKEAISFLRSSLSPMNFLYFYYTFSEMGRLGHHRVFVIGTHHEFTSWHDTDFVFCSLFSF